MEGGRYCIPEAACRVVAAEERGHEWRWLSEEHGGWMGVDGGVCVSVWWTLWIVVVVGEEGGFWVDLGEGGGMYVRSR